MAAHQNLPTLPFSRGSILDIAPQARELLHEQPIARVRTLVGDEAWLVTGYHLMKEWFDEFTDPDRVDFTRQSNPHLAFGYGPRRCLGANLARRELSMAFPALFRRFPTLRLAEQVENLEFSGTQMVERLARLPVTW